MLCESRVWSSKETGDMLDREYHQSRQKNAIKVSLSRSPLTNRLLFLTEPPLRWCLRITDCSWPLTMSPLKTREELSISVPWEQWQTRSVRRLCSHSSNNVQQWLPLSVARTSLSILLYFKEGWREHTWWSALISWTRYNRTRLKAKHNIILKTSATDFWLVLTHVNDLRNSHITLLSLKLRYLWSFSAK